MFKINRICCCSQVCSETSFAAIDMIVRTMYFVGYLYVNYSSFDDFRRSLAFFKKPFIFEPFYRAGDENYGKIEALRLVKLIVLIADFCCSTPALLLLLVGACTLNVLLLRLWMKLWLIFMLFVIMDIALYTAVGVIRNEYVSVVVSIVFLILQGFVYVLMMSLVNAHWRSLAELTEGTETKRDPKEHINHALSQFSDMPMPFKPKGGNMGRWTSWEM